MDRIAYSVEEAADISRLGRNLIYSFIRNGSLRIRKAGRRTIILHKDLLEFLDGLPAGKPTKSERLPE